MTPKVAIRELMYAEAYEMGSFFFSFFLFLADEKTDFCIWSSYSISNQNTTLFIDIWEDTEQGCEKRRRKGWKI